MNLFQHLFDLIESVWNADQKIREEGYVGESEFERRIGRIWKCVFCGALVILVALAGWWLIH